jgi:hypothetical protein
MGRRLFRSNPKHSPELAEFRQIPARRVNRFLGRNLENFPLRLTAVKFLGTTPKPSPN